MSWHFNGTQAVFIQIADRLRGDIVNGKYLPETQIPSVRQLAFDASVNPNTMQRALSILESEGLLVTKSTSGRFVTEDVSVIESTLADLQREYLDKVISEGLELGITKDKFIKYIEERTDIIW